MKKLILAFLFLFAILGLLIVSKNPEFTKLIMQPTPGTPTPTVTIQPTAAQK